jgi:hypothetical protein
MPLKVLAFVDLVVIDEIGIRPIDPTPRSLILFAGKYAHGHRNGDALGVEKTSLVFPIFLPSTSDFRLVRQVLQHAGSTQMAHPIRAHRVGASSQHLDPQTIFPACDLPSSARHSMPACWDQKQDVKVLSVRESFMPSNDDQCPTCDGSGFVARGDQRYPCPTCSPTSDAGGPYLAADPDQSNALSVVRSVAYGLGAAALIAVLVLVIKALWH